jgi:peroxiredoxin (alkyl hydroperoxide reductase subunit C)
MDNYKALMIGEKAPHFQSNSTYGLINFPDDYKGKWVIFFSHPGDFTPVCTTEIMTFASMKDEFGGIGCNLLGLSVDSNPSHIAWAREMEKYKWKNIKDVKITFPIIADDFGTIAILYGMLMPTASATKTVRTVFIIDPSGVIRAILIYPLTTGRNLQEIKRLVIALQAYDATGNPTPCDWVPSEEQVFPAPQTLSESQKRLDGQHANGYYCLDWYIGFVKDKINKPLLPPPMKDPYITPDGLSPMNNMQNKNMPSSVMPANANNNSMMNKMPYIIPDNIHGNMMNDMSSMMPSMTVPQTQVSNPMMNNMPVMMPDNIHGNMMDGIQGVMPGMMPNMTMPPKQNNNYAMNNIMSDKAMNDMIVKPNTIKSVMPESPKMQQPQQPSQGKKVFTLSELARYNGKMGMPPYASVNGMVYDITSVASIPAHADLKPGTDSTKEFTKCHMGMSYLLSQLPVMGTLSISNSMNNMPDNSNDYMITRDYPANNFMK